MTALEEKKKPRKVNSGEEAYNAILNGITSGELKPGLVVSEHDLSEMYGVGRTPIREALKRLEGEGFIINSDRKRRVYYLTADDIKQLFDLKMVIEGMIAYQAALSEDESDMMQMEAIVAEMERYTGGVDSAAEHDDGDAISLEKWLELDKRFHDHLYHMARNNRARTIIDNLNAQWHRIRVGMSAITGHLERSVVEHLRVGHAVIHREPEVACAAMKAHFENLKKYIISLMNTFGN